jgi:iron-sulfur cluster insertion protein
MSESLIFTVNAAAKVWELIQEEENYNLKLRVYVTGGGCSGFQYGFKFDEMINDDDTIVIQEVKLKKVICADKSGDGKIDDSEEGGEGSQTVQLLVDPISYPYLVGAEIDYKEDLEGAQFIIRNPNAKTTCGCGSSFST